MQRDRASRPVGVLDGIMAVIPRTSILDSSEIVNKVVSRSNRTLSDAIDSVHMHGLVLSEALQQRLD